MGNLERLVTEQNVWLATTRPDGRPHVVPIWFLFEDERFWICTGADSVKVRNLHVNASASVSLEDGNNPAVAEGVAAFVAKPYPQPVVAGFQRKYRWDIEADDDPDLGITALFVVTVSRWLMGNPIPD